MDLKTPLEDNETANYCASPNLNHNSDLDGWIPEAHAHNRLNEFY